MTHLKRQKLLGTTMEVFFTLIAEITQVVQFQRLQKQVGGPKIFWITS